MRRIKAQSGVTLLELLIVLAIIGILAAVIVPRVSSFLSVGQLSAAQQEVALVKTSALAYYVDADSYPVDTNTTGGDNSLLDGPGNQQYIDKAAKVNYAFDQYGQLVSPEETWPADSDIVWNGSEHNWERG